MIESADDWLEKQMKRLELEESVICPYCGHVQNISEEYDLMDCHPDEPYEFICQEECGKRFRVLKRVTYTEEKID